MAFSNMLLTPKEMAQADSLTIAVGTPGAELMAHAGAAVASEIRRRWPACRVVVLCGPGNNGGDGFVVARLLAEAGWEVRVALLGPREALHGDAAHHASLWTGAVEPLSPEVLEGADLIVDALFGTGLSRPLSDAVTAVLREATSRDVPIVAVDVPSGVFGETGEDTGAAPARLTVTFFRKKPGHLLQPGRGLCGEIVVADIGISDRVLPQIAARTFENGPALWQSALPRPPVTGNKFSRGHALIRGGYPLTGAARLAARGAARVGAGLVTIAVPEVALPIYAAALTSIMVAPVANADDLGRLLEDRRISGLLIGPGAGRGAEIRAHVLAMLAASRPVVLDADVFSAFADAPEVLFQAIHTPCVMTPHEGEFARIFQVTGDKLRRARAAAVASGAVVVLKGSDTVVAAPDGRAAINANAPPTLATAGAGDVLGGIILGLITQGMAAFEAACAGVWLHGAAAQAFGPGLMAEDLPDLLPGVLRSLAPQVSEPGQL